jgi:hypothetical protein
MSGTKKMANGLQINTVVDLGKVRVSIRWKGHERFITANPLLSNAVLSAASAFVQIITTTIMTTHVTETAAATADGSVCGNHDPGLRSALHRRLVDG